MSNLFGAYYWLIALKFGIVLMKGSIMDNTIKIDDKELDFDVLNALNLHHPYLGEAYSNFGWNPLGENFSLDIPFIERYLEAAKVKEQDKAPDFLKQDPKKVFEAFKTASKNNKEMISTLKERLEKGEFANIKGANITSQVKDILFFLESRQKMLEISIGQLSLKNIDALKAYRNISSINRKLSQLLEEAYLKEFNQNVALGNMILQAQFEHQNKQNKTYDFSDVLTNLLGKNFSPNQIFTPEKSQEKVKSVLQTIKNKVEDFVKDNQQAEKTISDKSAREKLQQNTPEQKQDVKENKVSNNFKLSQGKEQKGRSRQFNSRNGRSSSKTQIGRSK